MGSYEEVIDLPNRKCIITKLYEQWSMATTMILGFSQLFDLAAAHLQCRNLLRKSVQSKGLRHLLRYRRLRKKADN